MPEPDDDPTKVYAISPDYMSRMIDLYLTPVVDELGELHRSYSDAHAEVKGAHASEALGWFGGEGHGEVKAATSSFLNEVGYQLEQLVADQNALASSLAGYRKFLQDHITWARQNDQLHADRFTALQRELDEFRRS